MKKKLLYVGTLLIAATTMFFGCNPNDETPAAITVADNGALTQEVFADAQTGKSGVSFTTAAAWSSEIAVAGATAASQQMRTAASGWISINPDHGDKAGDYTVVITLLPNTTGANRTATITISCESTEIVITVTQRGTSADGTVPDGYGNLSQQQIVDLLKNAWDVFGTEDEFGLTQTGTDNGIASTRTWGVNRTQKKALLYNYYNRYEAPVSSDGSAYTYYNTIDGFEFYNNLTKYEYSVIEPVTSTMSGSIAGATFTDKYSADLPADFWQSFTLWQGGKGESGFENYQWTYAGGKFIGSYKDPDSQQTVTGEITLNPAGKIASINNGFGDVITAEYSDVNPVLPVGFGKPDFTFRPYGGSGSITETYPHDYNYSLFGAYQRIAYSFASSNSTSDYRAINVYFRQWDTRYHGEEVYPEILPFVFYVNTSNAQLPAGTYTAVSNNNYQCAPYRFDLNHRGEILPSSAITVTKNGDNYTITLNINIGEGDYENAQKGKIQGTYTGYLPVSW
jgi:hypothetical protein